MVQQKFVGMQRVAQNQCEMHKYVRERGNYGKNLFWGVSKAYFRGEGVNLSGIMAFLLYM